MLINRPVLYGTGEVAFSSIKNTIPAALTDPLYLKPLLKGKIDHVYGKGNKGWS
jgi:hypothetical protein